MAANGSGLVDRAPHGTQRKAPSRSRVGQKDKDVAADPRPRRKARRRRADTAAVEGGARRLFAVVHFDMVGYSRLISQADFATVERLRHLRRELIEPNIERHAGKLVQTAGDALLIVFESATQAVRCAIAVQSAIPAHDGAGSRDQQIRFRAGIDVGEAIEDGTDLHGDGVNIAARLQEVCPPGAICISRTVHEHVMNRLDVRFESLGELALKNIDRSVEAFVWYPETVGSADRIPWTAPHVRGQMWPRMAPCLRRRCSHGLAAVLHGLRYCRSGRRDLIPCPTISPAVWWKTSSAIS